MRASPDVVTFINCRLKACGTLGFLEFGEVLHANVNNCGFLEKTVVPCTPIVDMCTRRGMLKMARQVFFEIPKLI